MSLSEFDIIDRYFAPLGGWQLTTTALGPGDDCAVLSPRVGHQICISSDTLIEGVHFPVAASGTLAAERSLAAAVSDLAAMGSEPMAATGALTLTEVSESWLKDFSSALATCIKEWQIPLIGGNISRGKELSITWTVLGSLPMGRYVTRGGAQLGDDIYVSGWPGRAGLALEQLIRHQEVAPELRQHYERPTPRIKIGQKIRPWVSEMIDVSDGLLSDLQHILLASKCGADVDVSALGFDVLLGEQTDSALHHLTHVLSAGDDYELCFTAPPSRRGELQLLAQVEVLPFTRIGQIVPGAGVLFSNLPPGVNASDLEGLMGYRHFQ